nr:hypothetical protein L203_01989 [Cryptococcus depauperatus CBS 7841]
MVISSRSVVVDNMFDGVVDLVVTVIDLRRTSVILHSISESSAWADDGSMAAQTELSMAVVSAVYPTYQQIGFGNGKKMGYRHKTAGIWNRGRHGRAEMSRVGLKALEKDTCKARLLSTGQPLWLGARMTAGGLDGVCEGELCGQGQGNEWVEIVSRQQLQRLYARVE